MLDELQIEGCFIRDVRQPRHHELVFELYRPRGRGFWVLASFAQRTGRLHRLGQRPRELGQAQRFVSFMRAHVRGGRVASAAQLGEERIVELVIGRAAEQRTIWLRFWGGAGNCIVTDSSGTILDALFRRPRRGEVSGGHYDPRAELATLQQRRGSRREFAIRSFAGDTEQASGDGVVDSAGAGERAAPDTYSARMERYFTAVEDGERQALEARRQEKARLAEEQRLTRTIEQLQRQTGGAENHERLTQLGTLLLSNLAAVTAGATWVEVDDFATGELVRIELDPTLAPAANAQRYFTRAKAARRRAATVGERLTTAQAALAALRGAAGTADATPAATPRAASGQARAGTDRQHRQPAPAGLSLVSGRFTIWLGRSARESDTLLRRARGSDTWLHCRDFPGAHVFVRAESGKSVPLETLLDAGNLAVFFSKARAAGTADVYYTRVKYLRRVRGGRDQLGKVIPTRERNLLITVDRARVDRLLATRAGNGGPGS